MASLIRVTTAPKNADALLALTFKGERMLLTCIEDLWALVNELLASEQASGVRYSGNIDPDTKEQINIMMEGVAA